MGDAADESVKFDFGAGGEPGGRGGLSEDSFGGGGRGPRSFVPDGVGGPDFCIVSFLSPSCSLLAAAFLSEGGNVLPDLAFWLAGGGKGARSFFGDAGGGPDFFIGSFLSSSGLLSTIAFLSEDGNVLLGVTLGRGGRGMGPPSFLPEGGGTPDFSLESELSSFGFFSEDGAFSVGFPAIDWESDGLSGDFLAEEG